jgi:hypothetical protein
VITNASYMLRGTVFIESHKEATSEGAESKMEVHVIL